MSDPKSTTTAQRVPHPALAGPGWTATRTRQARILMAAIAVLAVVMVWAVAQPWYGFATSGTPTCNTHGPVPAITYDSPTAAQVVKNVYAAGCVSGLDIVNQGRATGDAKAEATLSSGATTSSATPGAMFGYPSALVLALAGAAFAALGLATRRGLFAGIGAAAEYYSFKDLRNLESAVMSGPGAVLTRPAYGLHVYAWAFMLTGLAAVVAACGVMYVNRQVKVAATRRAVAEGRTPPPSIADHLLAVLSAGGRAAKSVMDAAEERAKALDPH